MKKQSSSLPWKKQKSISKRPLRTGDSKNYNKLPKRRSLPKVNKRIPNQRHLHQLRKKRKWYRKKGHLTTTITPTFVDT